MANLINSEYFVHDINLPVGQFSDLVSYITRYEKDILQSLLGYELYQLVKNSTATEGRIYDLINGKEYTIEYKGRDQLIKWNGLVNTDKVSLIAYYVYCQYLRGKASFQTTSGAVVPGNESGTAANQSFDMFEAWNAMRELYGYEGQSSIIPSAYNFLKENESDYPELIFTEIGKLNAFDI